MTTTRVPMTFGLMERSTPKMKTYLVRYYISTWHEIPMKAQSIDNIRKTVINELRTGYNEIYTDSKNPKYLGTLFMSLAPDHDWTWNVDKKFWKIDPKTGKLRRK